MHEAAVLGLPLQWGLSQRSRACCEIHAIECNGAGVQQWCAPGASRDEVSCVGASVLHLDVLAFKSAVWASLGDAEAAFAELGALETRGLHTILVPGTS